MLVNICRGLGSVAGAITPNTIFGSALTYWGNSQNITLNGSNVSTVTNLTGGSNVVQGTAANQPEVLTAVVNGYNAIHNSSASRCMFGTGFSFSGNTYFALVARLVNIAQTSYGRVLGIAVGAFNDYNGTTSCSVLLRDNISSNLQSFHQNFAVGGYAGNQDTTYRLYEIYLNVTDNKIQHWVNGVQTMDATPGATLNINANSFLMGMDNTTFPNSLGYAWPEVLVTTNFTLTTAQQAASRNYIKTKYNLGF